MSQPVVLARTVLVGALDLDLDLALEAHPLRERERLVGVPVEEVAGERNGRESCAPLSLCSSRVVGVRLRRRRRVAAARALRAAHADARESDQDVLLEDTRAGCGVRCGSGGGRGSGGGVAP